MSDSPRIFVCSACGKPITAGDAVRARMLDDGHAEFEHVECPDAKEIEP